MGKPAGQKEAKQESQNQANRANVEFQQKQADREKILPLASALMGLGIDPQTFLSSPLGQSILGTQRQGLSNEFDAARMNLIEGLGATGTFGSGVGTGPLANLFGQEALANSQLISQLPLTGLDLSLQGSNILQGQQAQLNPLGFGSSAIGGFNSLQQGQWGKNILGAAGAVLGGQSMGSLLGGGQPPPVAP